MVTTDSEIISQGEVVSPGRQANGEHPNNQMLQSLGRQSSIYSLTLDEFQSTLCDRGRVGSMNMDEFINSIWTFEENQVHTTNTASPVIPAQRENNDTKDKGLLRQNSLLRQGSLTIPEPMINKTVEEVWAEINITQPTSGGQRQSHVPKATQRQVTLGEMTLEDFLVCAGIVRELDLALPAPAQPSYGNFQNANHNNGAPNSTPRPVLAGGMTVPPPQGGAVDGQGYTGGLKRDGSGGTPQPLGITCSGRTGNGSGGFGAAQGLGNGSPLSPMLSDASQLDVANQYGFDLSGVRSGRKRNNDGPPERIVERRQRRMIKNRESAARSRARKQAYTVELEAELNQLKEENIRLKQAVAEIQRKRRQQLFAEARGRAHVKTKAEKTKEKLRALRRTVSSSF